MTTATWQNRIVSYGEASPDQLLAHPLNFRLHPKHQQDALSGVLSDVGIVQNIIVNTRTGHVVDGHLRITLALKQKQPTVPVTYVDLSEEEEALILATLDPIAAMAGMDSDNFAALMDQVSTDDAAVRELLDSMREPVLTTGLTDPDDVPPVPDDPITRPGDLWLLGRHRLLCGDATVASDVERLMGGEKARLVFTSPPYAEQRDYEGNVQPWDQLMNGVFSILPTTDDAQVLVNLGLTHNDNEWQPYWQDWVELMREIGWRRFGWYVWDQGPGLPGDWNGRLAPSFEFVFHFNRQSKQAAKWVDKLPDSIKVNTHGSGIRRKNGQMSGVSNARASLQPTKIPDNVIRVMRHKARDIKGHPAMFPVDLPTFVLQTWPGLLYEPFVGSGSSIVAAEMLGRTCYAMELSPKYVDIAVTRWSQFTGQTATRATEQMAAD